MKSSVIIVLSGFLCATLSAQQKDMSLPDPVQAGDPGYLKGELVYDLEGRQTPECHASTLVETSSGIVAAWFGGSHEKNEDVGIWVAHLGEEGWSTPVEVANGIQDENLRYPCWNPVLFQPGEGPLMLFYKVGPDPRQWWGELKTSTDQGRTWSVSRKLGSSRLGHLIGPVKNKPIQLEDGAILCPSSTERIEQGITYWQVHFELSRDLGKSWEVIGPINDGLEFDAIQPSILCHEDGSLQILCRTIQDVISESWSTDGGLSWSAMKATELPNPNAGTDAVTLRDGRQLLVYNHSVRGRQAPGRGMLNVAVSRDGHSWTPVLTLENQDGEFSYPAVIQTADGLVHITYTYHRKSVKYVVLDPQRLVL